MPHVSIRKWVKLCQLYLVKKDISSTPETEHQISNSVLLLYRSYPGEPDLVDYFRQALKEGLVSLPIFVSTFLQAARSPEIQTSASLDMLCRVALDAHYSSNCPPIGSVVPSNAASATIIGTVQDALALLRSATSLPPSHFHQLSTSAAELATLLISCLTDISQIPISQALIHLSEVRELLQNFPLSSSARMILQHYAISLEAVVGDDVKAAQEAQIMQSVSISTYGKGDFIESSSYSDIISFGLLFNQLVHHRGSKYGAGSGNDPLTILLVMFRWSSWTPTVFYTQLLSAAFTALSQSSGTGAWLWFSFVAGRLPSLISQFEAAVKSDASLNADTRNALQTSLSTVLRRSELMASCDLVANQIVQDASTPRSASREFLAGLIQKGLIDTSFAVGIDVVIADDKVPRIGLEARDAGFPDLQTYLTNKMSPDMNFDDITALLGRVSLDPTSHASFAHVITDQAMRLTASSPEVEMISHLCKLLLVNDNVLDIVSLHEPVSHLVYTALRFIDTYDFETVGDPQTAVAHLGDIVLFAQYTMAKFNLNFDTFSSGPGIVPGSVSSQFIKSVDIVYPIDDLPREDLLVHQSWFKTLFDSSSEGIDDSILRSTNPKTLLRLAATFISHAVLARQVQKIDVDVFHNVLRLCGSQVLTMFTKLNPFVAKSAQMFKYNLDGIRQVTANAIGFNETANSSTTPQQIFHAASQMTTQPKLAIQVSLALARAGKAPSLDIETCLLVTPPAKFLQLLWSECLAAAALGETDACRRIATFVLTTPRSPNTPPLLPIFLYIVLPALLASIDKQVTGEPPMGVELLSTIITSSLTAALHLEWALRTVGGEASYPLGGQPSTIMARRLGMNLRMKKQSHTSSLLAQKLAMSQPFMTNFPHFINE
ncbi:hypothetical protein ONZ45_g18524 [Pleurotus djamor]|nr:hypothetical protein ONZ45_g18524 [Pleurotus djamor]